MLFNRMVVHNVERIDNHDAERFVYKLTKDDSAEIGSNEFGVSKIKLLDNGWVWVTHHNDGVECFPPNRVVDLEASHDFDTYDHDEAADG
jgi:hypothetical protein